MARLLACGKQASPRATGLALLLRRKTIQVVLQFFLRHRKQIDPALQGQRVHGQEVAPDRETQTDAAPQLRAEQGEGNAEFEDFTQRHLNAVTARLAIVRRKARQLVAFFPVG